MENASVMDVETVRRVLSEEMGKQLDHRRTVSEEQHRTDHEFIELLRDREARRQKRWDQVTNSTLGFVVIALIGGIGSAVVVWVKDHLK